MIEIVGIVQNPLAGFADDDLVILSNLLEDLRTNADLANLADIIPRGSDSDSSARLADTLIAGYQIR